MRRKKLLSFILLILITGILIPSLNAQQKNLDFFLSTGLTNSPLLKDYGNRIRSAAIDSLRIRAGQKIQVNASSVNSYAPVVHGWGYDEVKTDIAELSAVVQVSKEITWNKNLQNKFEAIRIQNQSALLEGNLSARDLKKAIISQYIIAYGDQQYRELNSQVLNLLRQEEMIVKKLAENGYYRQTEYLSFVVSIRQQEIAAEKSASQFNTDYETLNYMCGIYDTARCILAMPALAVNPVPVMTGTPFFRQFMIDSLRLRNNDRQIDFDYQPKLSVFADGGYLSSLASTPWKNFGMSAGLTLSVPIYDGKQKQMQHEQIAISESTRSNYRDFFMNQYRQQIALLKHQLEAADQISKKTDEQQRYAGALVDANRLLLNTGDIPVSEYLLSVTNYITANNMLIENKIERYRILNELNYWSEK